MTLLPATFFVSTQVVFCPLCITWSVPYAFFCAALSGLELHRIRGIWRVDLWHLGRLNWHHAQARSLLFCCSLGWTRIIKAKLKILGFNTHCKSAHFYISLCSMNAKLYPTLKMEVMSPHILCKTGLKHVPLLKTLSVILYSKLYFFPNPHIFLHIQREFHYNKLPVQQFSQKQHIFGKRDNLFSIGN